MLRGIIVEPYGSKHDFWLGEGDGGCTGSAMQRLVSSQNQLNGACTLGWLSGGT
jgi:hypothetical protein